MFNPHINELTENEIQIISNDIDINTINKPIERHDNSSQIGAINNQIGVDIGNLEYGFILTENPTYEKS